MTSKPPRQKISDVRTQMGCLYVNGKAYPVYEGVNFIGRNKDATVILKDLSVSQQHAIITIVNENQHFLSDIGSFNGTIVGKDKLNPLLLYELSHELEIHFANSKATYKKVPDSQLIADHCYNNRSIETGQNNTQNLNESFYTAETQVLENPLTKVGANANANTQPPACNYFEDDYNFADIPSPPVCHTDTVNVAGSSKSGLSIHEMPTQVYCADVADDVLVYNREVQTGHQSSTTKVDVHDLPTQIICREVATNESVGETDTNDVSQGSAAQIAGKISSSNQQLDDINNANTRRDTVHYKLTQPMVKKTKLSQNNDLDDTLQNKDTAISSSKTDRKSVVDTSSEIIEATVLDDSGLDVTVQSSQANSSGKSSLPAIPEEKVISSLESDPQPPLHVSQLHHRAHKPIPDDTEDDDVASSESEIKKTKSKSTNKKPISESCSEDSNSEVICKQKKKCRLIESEDSGSETDIEDFLTSGKVKTVEAGKSSESKVAETNNKTETDKNHTSNNDSSGSDTEIEDFKTQVKSLGTAQNNTKMGMVGKAHTNELEVEERSKPKEPSKNAHVNEDNSGSDTDMGDFESNAENKVFQKKTVHNANNSNKLSESDIIPASQVSNEEEEDDDDDFNFMPESNSTLIAKANSEHTKQTVFNVSQKLKELRNATIVPQNFSEESLHLRLSENTEGGESIKRSGSEKHEDDDDKTPDISDIEDSDDVCSKTNQPDTDKLNEDIFNKPTQKITIDELANEVKSQDIFAMETQQLTEEILQRKKDDEIFVKPRSSLSLNSKKKGESQKDVVEEDDFFMQPTQPLMIDNVKGAEEAVHSKQSDSNNGDIFMQPTQLLEVPTSATDAAKDDENLFMQPTQKINLVDSPVSKPAQMEVMKPSTSTKNQPSESIFMEATQLLDIPTSVADAKKHDDNDLFMQPTQKINLADTPVSKPAQMDVVKPSTSTENQPSESIFMEATQLLEIPTSTVDAKKHDDNDLFMQPTQILNLDDPAKKPKQEGNVDKQKVEFDVVRNDIFSQPTQLYPVETAVLKKDNTDESFFTEATQLIELPESAIQPSTTHQPLGHTKVDKPSQPSEKHSLSLNKKPAERNKFDELESQLEVMFASQTPKVSSQTNSRPSNPLVNVFEGKQDTDSQPNSNELEANAPAEDLKSLPGSLEPTPSLKEYCERSTLPIDELDDFQPEQNKDDKARKRGFLQKNVLQTSKETDIADTPRKRGRPSKNSIKEMTPKELNVADTSRRRGRPRKVTEHEDDSKSAGSDETSKMSSTDENNDLLEQEPCTSNSTKQTKGGKLMKSKVVNIDQDEVNKEANKKKEKGQARPDSDKVSTRANSSSEAYKYSENENKVTRQRAHEEENISRELPATKGRSKRRVQASSKTNEGDADGKQETTEESNTKQIKTGRVTRHNTVNEQNDESNKNTDKKKNVQDSDSAGSEVQKENTVKKSVRNKSKTDISNLEGSGEKSERNDRQDSSKKSPVKQILGESSKADNKKKTKNEDGDKSTTKADVQNKINKKTTLNDKKSNETPNTSGEVKKKIIGTRTRKKKADDVSIITVSSDNSDEEDLQARSLMTSRTKRRKVNNDNQSKEENTKIETRYKKAGISSKLEILTPKKRGEKLLSTSTEESTKQSHVTKRAHTRNKTSTIETSEDDSASNDPQSSASILLGRKRRTTNKDSEERKAKKFVPSESSESEESGLRNIGRKNPCLNVTAGTPDRSRRVQKPKVAFTMLDKGESELESLVRSLGGMVADTTNTCTVLVAGCLKRSAKLLSAVGQGKPVCSTKWLQECKKAYTFLDPWDFILEDKEAEKKWKFSLKEALNKSRNNRLLEEYTVLLTPNDGMEALKAAIESCGGKCVIKALPKNVETNLIVVGNPAKKASYARFLKRNPPVMVVSPEAIFDGVLRQELHWDDHQLT